MSSARELPLPTITQITTLRQAHATLLLCWTKLSKFNREQTPTGSFAWSPKSITHERQTFQDCLERWEIAFTAFLSNGMASMTNDEMMHSRVLKCNHLACTVLASDLDPPSHDLYEEEFRAIIELAGAVLRSRHVSDSPRETKTVEETISIPEGLDVQEPLLVVLSRCDKMALRIRANELVSIFFSRK